MLARYLARQLAKFAADLATTSSNCSVSVARELKMLREPLPKTAVRKLGACNQPEDETTATLSEDRWRQQLLITAGDVEPIPGPARKRPCLSHDLLQADVMPRTAAR